MAFKIKQEKTAPEIEMARSKLEEALQNIMEKTDETSSTSEDEGNKCMSEIVIKKEPSPVSSPTKRPTQRVQRKRRRKDETLHRNTNSYVMKLYDRAVDLSPFTEDTPLYPICRAWISNQSVHTPPPKEEPQLDETKNNDDSDKGSEDPISEDVYQLPPPKPLNTSGRDPRIPSPIPQPEEEFIICSDDQNGMSRELLMSKHIHRWKAVRRKWKDAAKANEDRYKESAAILKSMFERSQQREETLATEQWENLQAIS